MNARKVGTLLVFFLILTLTAHSEELPIPTYANSVIISIEHSVSDSTEVDYILANFDFGLYAWPSFSITHLAPNLGWYSDWDNASVGIQSFKNSVNSMIQAAKAKGVKIHIVLCSGFARSISIYKDAKEEDTRNCQWYNDNNIASDSQILDSGVLGKYVFATLSRYARKLRANLKAKSQAALAFLKQKMDEEPDTLIALSGWGEVEMNYHRGNFAVSLQDYICDYSPFAVLEFRDWIQHSGMYDDATGEYKGQGYAQGGAKYQGVSGLTQFNTDFGTSFSSWGLKYYDWSLSDDWDPYNQDSTNNDPHRTPYDTGYTQNGMMPTSGGDYIAGGFDPPRVMTPGNDFYDLWQEFRETVVFNFVNDMAKWVDDADIPAEKWFSHQIPADYLFGTNPSSPEKNGRYYTSASPLSTADIQPYGSVGATIYDIKFPTWFARTTQYCVPAISEMASNWAIMEYDPETYPVGLDVTESTPAVIYDQYINVYNYNTHLINFWRWIDSSGEHKIKGKNKEIALRNFIEAIRDKARNTNLNTVFSPPKVIDVTGSYVVSSGAIRVVVSGKIWSGHDWEWKDWGDFDHFEVHRSTEPNFTPSGDSLVGTTSDYSYDDTLVSPILAYFYKLRAVNGEGTPGPYSDEVMLIPSSTDKAILYVDNKDLLFGAEVGKTETSAQNVVAMNLDDSGTTINWTAEPQTFWLQAFPGSGLGDRSIAISVDITGLSVGTYAGEVWVQDPAALNSPQKVSITLTVYSSSEESEPFGVFDTPVEGSTVSGNIPVTGWALDDVEVTRIEIKRNSHPDDNPAAIGPDGLVYIGDAIFVKGARMDVAAVYPDYPRSDRAGWGYMMLTNFLPNSGNGDFTIYAFAYDGSGNRVQLGTKLIHCDNANRVKPFGTIDTPAQGGMTSGAAYANFGWALTPPPKMIPTDGSTIWVFIDGVPKANPAYNLYRGDIAALFPGYLNSDGAVGLYYIDTTLYSNGVHNIAWSVTDDDGATDGIGSRYFEVQNLGGGNATAGVGVRIPFQEDTSGRLQIKVKLIEIGKRPDRFRAYNQDQMEDESESGFWHTAYNAEPLRIEIEELERIVLRLERSSWGKLIGWGTETSRSLPVGSTLDDEKGLFYWMPGPGFLGRHVLNFAVSDGTCRGMPVRVIVDIRPKTFK